MSSCSHNRSVKEENKSLTVEDIKQSLLPAFRGVWVKTDYITAIEKTKSPAKSSAKLQGFVTLIIDKEAVGDSLEIGSSYSNHMGDFFYLYLKTGVTQRNLKTSISDNDDKTNFFELGVDITESDTVLFICHYDKTNRLLDKNQFTKVSNKQIDDDASWGLQYIVNEKLFAGDYKLIDSTGTASNIHFNSDGSVTGFRDFKNYKVWTDFAAPGPDDNISDAIFFTDERENETGFDFEFKGNTLILKKARQTTTLLKQ